MDKLKSLANLFAPDIVQIDDLEERHKKMLEVYGEDWARYKRIAGELGIPVSEVMQLAQLSWAAGIQREVWYLAEIATKACTPPVEPWEKPE